jgi:hypothetical protein
LSKYESSVFFQYTKYPADYNFVDRPCQIFSSQVPLLLAEALLIAKELDLHLVLYQSGTIFGKYKVYPQQAVEIKYLLSWSIYTNARRLGVPLISHVINLCWLPCSMSTK